MARGSNFTRDQKKKAVRLVAEAIPHHESEYQAIASVAAKIGAATETVRKWVRQEEIDQGTRQGTSTDESEELKKLRRENAELRRANEILKSASAFFAAELDRPGPR